MKILVCISKAPDTTSKIAFSEGNTKFDENGVQFIVNPYDEWYALVRALELKEQAKGSVTLFHVGPKANEAIIRKGLAIGADKAVRVDMEPKSALAVAKQIVAHAKEKNYNALFFGKETIDYNGSEVPAMVAELLGLPFISHGVHMDVAGTVATVQRDIEGGRETVEVDFPFVISCAKGMAEQRIPNLRRIMMAKRKKIEVMAPVPTVDMVGLVQYAYPPSKTGVKLIDPNNMDELVNLLHNEAKVI